MNTSSNSKRIAQNTILLYFRMFITMAVSLYTSRIVLNVLGISDYGIYNIVGGIITIASFLNSAMVAASQRFISFELGRGDIKRLNNVFCTSVNIHLLIALIIVIIGETIGLWFVNSQLNIPEDRMVAANWVYQFSILTFIFTIISVPYNSCIVAHEHMKVYAYISIFEVIMKLVIVYALLISTFDHLILYSILLSLVSIIIRCIYSIYCNKHFKECKYHKKIDKNLTLKMFSFAGWSVLGNMGFTFKDQISNIILNIFFGTTINAARGIGLQISNLINTFSTNFTMALNPQITKQYAAGNLYESRKLVFTGARLTFFLLSIISIPVIINIDYILKIWLGTVPKYTSEFMILSIITCLLYSLSSSITTAIQATGNVKVFQITISIIMLSELPVDYLLMKLGYKPYYIMFPTIATYSIAIFFRYLILKRLVPNYKFKPYFFDVVLRCLLVFSICIIISVFIRYRFNDTFISLIVTSVISFLITGVIIFYGGLKRNEQYIILEKVKIALAKYQH